MSKNFKKNLLFSSPFFEFENVNLASKLHQHINTLNIDGIESNVANQVKHNLSESKFDFFNSEVDVIKETRTFLASCLKDILNNLYNSDDDYKIAFTDSWYHVGTKNSSHDLHAHINCSWCGIFYIQSGELDKGGHTFFCNPIFSNFLDIGTVHHNDTEHIVIPKNGKLVFFPSYLKHFQSIYEGNEQRVVVAFNCSILEKY